MVWEAALLRRERHAADASMTPLKTGRRRSGTTTRALRPRQGSPPEGRSRRDRMDDLGWRVLAEQVGERGHGRGLICLWFRSIR